MAKQNKMFRAKMAKVKTLFVNSRKPIFAPFAKCKSAEQGKVSTAIRQKCFHYSGYKAYWLP